MSHIFISYSTKNADYSTQLANKLRSEGFDVWIDNARLRSGQDWWKSIVLALRSCDAVVVILTPDSDESEWVQNEITLAKKYNKPIFPLWLAGSKDTPNWEIFVRTQTLDVRGDKLPPSDFYENLAEFTTRTNYRGADVTDVSLDENATLVSTDAFTEGKPSSLTTTLVNSRAEENAALAHAVQQATERPPELSASQTNRDFQLIVRRGPQPNLIFDLNQDIITIGRDITNDITINDVELSRHHTRFTRTLNGFSLEDLGSTNGTFVNGQRVTNVRVLNAGDLIGMGETVTLAYEFASTRTSTPIDWNAGYFRLIVRRGPQPNQTYDLHKDIITIGRDITNDITINDLELSRHHTRFMRTLNGFTLEDLGSTNGTFVNGHRLTGAKLLNSGDMIGLGETVTIALEFVQHAGNR